MKFPKVLYVTIEKENNGTDYTVSHFTAEEAAEIGETRTVGIYKLERVGKISAEVKLK